jgi:hypothetical protein
VLLLALAMLLRPSASWVTWPNLLGTLWLLALGTVILTSLSLPIEELLSVVWVVVLGLAGAVMAHACRPPTAPA